MPFKFKTVEERNAYNRRAMRRWRAANPEKARAANLRWRRAHPEQMKAHDFKHNHSERRKAWKMANKDALLARAREWAAKNPEVNRASHVDERRRMRKEVFDHYGGKCVCCGESNQWFFTIDHVNNDGADHRRVLGRNMLGHKFYRWLRRNGYPEGFQVLCFNCNCAKGFWGVCPHEIGAEEKLRRRL